MQLMIAPFINFKFNYDERAKITICNIAAKSRFDEDLHKDITR